MTKKQAFEYLAECVADYVSNREPLEPLTGVDRNGPDRSHVRQLRDALVATGWKQAADKLPAYEEFLYDAPDETGPNGRCDTCGSPCDVQGCTEDRNHETAS